MDPSAALDEAERLLNDGDFDDAAERLDGYFAWRNNGGFEPVNGDKRALALFKRVVEEA